MKHPFTTAALFLTMLPIAPLLAQAPQIGGGTCSSSTVNGSYAVGITGRKVNTSGTFSNVFQAVGAATFDGQSKVTISLNSDTNQSVTTPLTWSGTYSVQANCAGVITITSGGSAILNFVTYAQGVDLVITGSDAVYTYAGSANNQPTTCSAAAISGVYTVNATGFSLASNAPSGAGSGVGLLQFDGQGHVTVNFTLWASGVASNPLILTGSYSSGSNCLGSATLTDSKGNSYVMSLSTVNGSAVSTTTLYVTLSQNSKFIVSGTADAIYGQPTATANTGRSNQGGRA